MFLTIAPCLTFFLLRLHWTYEFCRWNKYSTRLNLSPVIKPSLQWCVKRGAYHFLDNLGTQTFRAAVPPLQAHSEAEASTPNLPISPTIFLALLTMGLQSKMLFCWSYTKAMHLNSSCSLGPSCERWEDGVFDLVLWTKCFIFVGLETSICFFLFLLPSFFLLNKYAVFQAAESCD